jgi:hypothetical protein
MGIKGPAPRSPRSWCLVRTVLGDARARSSTRIWSGLTGSFAPAELQSCDKGGTKHLTGYWAVEFIHPHQVFAKAGYDITIATPGGVAPTVDQISLRPDLNGGQADVDAQREYPADLGDTLAKSARLEDMNPADFDAVYVSGGHGPMEDLADNPVIGRVFAAMYPDKRKAVAADCYGVGALLPAVTRTARGLSRASG